jgi:hypothetical protein
MSRIPSASSTMPQQYFTHNYERLLRKAKLSLRQECLKRIGIIGVKSNDLDTLY